MKKIAAACAMLMTGCVYAAIPEGYVKKKERIRISEPM